MRGINLEDVLKNLGWEDGFQIPVSNAENKILEEEVARLTLQKIKAKNDYEEAVTKFEGLQNHLKYLQQESEQNQKLISAHKQQYEFEENNYRILKIKRDSVERETRNVIKSREDTKRRIEQQKGELQKGAAKLEKLKTEIQWDTEALKAWEDSIKKRYEDNEVIEKFSKVDERKYNELEAKRQALQMEHVTRTATINKMVGDLTEFEKVIEKTGKTIKQQVAERNALVEHWKEAVRTLHQRDNNIELYERQIFEANEVLHKQTELLEEQNNFLENEKNNNYQLTFEIEESNNLNSRVRRQYNDLVQHVLLLNSELEALKRTLASTASSLERERMNGKNLVVEISNKDVNITKLQNDLKNLQIKFESIQKAAMTSNERLQYLESLLEFEEKRHKTLLNENEKMQASLFRSRQMLQDAQNKYKLKEAEISGAHSAIRKLSKINANALNDLQLKKEIIYEMDFRIDQIENSIMKMERFVADDETGELKNQIEHLEAVLKEHEEVKNLLQAQIQHIEQDMSKLATMIAQDQINLTALQDKLQNERMLYEGGQKTVAAAKLRSQEKQVEENILKLRVNQFDKAMKREEENIYTLKKFRITIDQLMRERHLEISTNKDILLAKKRNLNDDKGRLRCDIMGRQIKIDQLQKKYHSALMLLGKDDAGQPLTLTHFKIKASQEKFLLQQEGDELDVKIQKAEKEIIAMENTLKVVNLTNSKFKKSLGIVDEDGEEATEMKELEQKLIDTNNVIRDVKKDLFKKKKELADMETKLQELEQSHIQAKETLIEYENKLQDVVYKDQETAEKIQRTDCNIRKLLKQLKNKSMEKYERDFEIRQLQEANKQVTARLNQLQNIYKEIGPLIRRYLAEYDLKLPDKSYVSSESSILSRNSHCSHSASDQGSARSHSKASNASSNISTVVLSFDGAKK